MKYQVELIWNREFAFVSFGELQDTMQDAIKLARAVETMGDGSSVKETRIVDENGKVVWVDGRLV